jgi:RNA polymerase primary sigma factor
MYLREMGSVELLSREGEIAIAKRIEAGRNTMIAGLCESPLTFQAITIWRDELLDEDILLRDVIDLETTFGRSDGRGWRRRTRRGEAVANPSNAGRPGRRRMSPSSTPTATRCQPTTTTTRTNRPT